MDTQERIKELEQQIQYHSDCYYNDGKPEISDAEFDELWDELTALAPNSEILESVGAAIKGAKLKHKTQMGSLAKATYDDEGGITALLKWAKTDTNHRGIADLHMLSMTPKIDGLAVRLNYWNGKLVQAATRGDGMEGQDITENVKQIESIPNQTDQGFSGEIRGEVYMKKSVFEQLRDSGLPFANPRNAAAGSLMQKDPKKTGERKLSFLAYDILFDDCDNKVTMNTETEKIWALKRLSGFDVVEQKRVAVSNLEKVIYDWEHNKRKNLDYEIDGMVFGFTSLAAQEDAGWSGKRPRGKIAWKFKPEQKNATLEAIDWQVGRTGKLTPVARISPTELAGTMVRNVTLHNYKMVKDHNLMPGDTLLVEKAGEIIPHLVRVVSKTASPISAQRPMKCPACSGDVVEEGAHLVCVNINCQAQLEARVGHYLKRLGMLGIGPVAIKSLVSSGTITDLSDLYFMNTDEVRAVLGSDIIARNMIQEIFNKDEIPLATFLSALGIHTLGRTTSKLLAKEFRSLQNIRARGIRLEELEGVGPTSANAIVVGLHDMEETIDRILEVIDVVDVEDATGPLAGMSFCLTGSMSRPRKSIAADIERLGGEVRSSVGKGLSYLVMADANSTSSKAKKARSQGTQCIDEDKLKELMTS